MAQGQSSITMTIHYFIERPFFRLAGCGGEFETDEKFVQAILLSFLNHYLLSSDLESSIRLPLKR